MSLQTPDSSTIGRRHSSAAARGSFECVIPNCKKVFRRKEHLTRHLKSHDTQLQYACHICGKRYARSDVLKRHVESHPHHSRPKRDFVACTHCRESKTKCDENIPCAPCHRRALRCVRADSVRVGTKVNQGIPRPRPPPALLSPPLSLIHATEKSKLRDYITKDPAAVQRRLGVYFAALHPTWPILEPSVISVSGSPALLIASIVMLASWIEGRPDHVELFPLVLDEIAEKQMDPNPSLPVLQAMALCILYSTCNLTKEGMAAKALKLHNALVTACRFAGILAPQGGLQFATSYAPSEEEDQEQRHRLAFAVLRLDAYLTALVDFPPLIRYQELFMPLSQSTCWANVATEEERRKLLAAEPAPRKKTSFGLRVHDLFGVPRPNVLAPSWTKMDYHFILCAIQSGAWEAAHQAHRTVPDDLHSRTHPHDLRHIWREYLSTWATSLEKDCQLRKEYFTTSPGDAMTPQTLLLWHTTTLKMQAPPNLWGLTERYHKFRRSTSLPPLPPEHTPRRTLQAWQASKVARVAVWHSAQIAGIASREFARENNTTNSPSPSTPRLSLNPLLLPSLLMSATVVCGYATHVRECPVCTGTGTVDLVHVFGAPENCDRLDRWFGDDTGLLASWGVHLFAGFALCRCNMGALSAWFREFLARDKRAEEAFLIFLDELKTGLW